MFESLKSLGNIKRVLYLFRAYFLLLKKYSFEFDDVLAMLRGYSPNLTGALTEIKRSLKSDDKEASIRQIYRHMNHLKTIIQDPHPSEATENIYYKRHIAADIPTMYGEYVEPKFDALGLMYRLERTVAKLMTQVTQPFNAEYITAKTFRQIYHILPGAMKTFLNVGMNDEIAAAYSKRLGYGWTAWDCYRHFLQSWGWLMTLTGMFLTG